MLTEKRGEILVIMRCMKMYLLVAEIENLLRDSLLLHEKVIVVRVWLYEKYSSESVLQALL